MVGNANDAARALAGTLPMIGEGCTRRVYVSGDVVYKVEYDPDYPNVNAHEYDVASTLTVPPGMAVPAMTLYPNGVLACEYIVGEYMGECYCVRGEAHMGCHDADTVKILNTISLDCATWGNTCMRDGTLYLIDLA